MKRATLLKGLGFGVVLAISMMVSWTGGAFAATRVEIKRIVIEEAQNSRVPPTLALAVAKVESDFQERALSSAGARGVMQIMPKTARNVFGVHEDELWSARLNIQLGIDYLEQLYDQYGGRWDLALSHYNGGTLKGGKGGNAQPHSYTRKYVADVLRWKGRYGEQATVWQVAAEQNQDGGWQPARTKSRYTDLDQTRRVLVRELKRRTMEDARKPTRLSQNADGGQEAMTWDVGETDFDQQGYAQRVQRARQSLDDFSSVAKWYDG